MTLCSVTFDLHFSRLCSLIPLSISLFKAAMSSESGCASQSLSRSLISSAVAVGISGIMFLILPARIFVLAALLIIFLKVFSALKMFVGGGRVLNCSSVSMLNCVQSALLKLMNVLFSLNCGLMYDVIDIVIRRWSELKVLWTCQEVRGRSDREAREISGEVGCCPLSGSLVGLSELRTPYGASFISSAKVEPLVSWSGDNQRESWALKSPRFRLSSVVRREAREGAWPAGQLLVGGR